MVDSRMKKEASHSNTFPLKLISRESTGPRQKEGRKGKQEAEAVIVRLLDAIHMPSANLVSIFIVPANPIISNTKVEEHALSSALCW
jgi:hypothetical protein